MSNHWHNVDSGHSRLIIPGEHDISLRRLNFFCNEEPDSYNCSKSTDHTRLMHAITKQFIKKKLFEREGNSWSLKNYAAITCTPQSADYKWEKEQVHFSNGHEISISLHNSKNTIKLEVGKHLEIDDLIKKAIKNNERILLHVPASRDWVLLDFSQVEQVTGLRESGLDYNKKRKLPISCTIS